MTNGADYDILKYCYIGAFDRKGDVMSEKRKDSKGRLLRTGESQRKDLTYMYRYKDNDGERRCVYAPTLQELREKEEDITDKLRNGIVLKGSQTSVINIVESHLATMNHLKPRTMYSYQNTCNKLRESPMGQRPIGEVTRQEMKLWFVELNKVGNGYGTLAILFGIMRNAFEEAVEDGFIIKNPCAFRLSQVVHCDLKPRDPADEEDIRKLLQFTRETKKYYQWYLILSVLALTGMRAGEVCGLAIRDIDFARNVITIRRQTTRMSNGDRKIDTLKTSSSERDFPMNEELRAVMRECIEVRRRDPIVPIIEGHSDFLFLTKDHKLRITWDIDHVMPNIIAYYNKKHTDTLPNITPHQLRHSFCTDAISRGMDPKSVQYLMGHATPTVTMRVYAHSRFEDVQNAYAKVYGA